jgi:hypothetical protein
MGVLEREKIPHKAPMLLHIEGHMSLHLRMHFCEASEVNFLAQALLFFNDNQASRVICFTIVVGCLIIVFTLRQEGSSLPPL